MSIFKPTGNRLLAFQVVAHLSIIPMIMYATWWQWGIALVAYLLHMLNFTVLLHRYATHNSFKCKPWAERLLVIHSTIGGASSAITWVALHQTHHKYADTPRDPQSPTYRGFHKIWLVMLADFEMRCAAGLLKKKLYVWQHNYYFAITLAYAALLCVISPFALVYAFLFPSAMYWLALTFIGYFGHRNDAPVNSTMVNVVLALNGEGYHYNHHMNPADKRYGKYDLGYAFVRMLEQKEST